jgi:diguanylate cyclase (GGDEF)-like protein
MTALPVEAACMACHGMQGYHIADVLGAVSLTLTVAELKSDLRVRAKAIGAVSGASVALVLVVMYLVTARVARRLGAAEKSLESLAATDEGTGLFNRRETLACLRRQFERSLRDSEVFSIVLLDLDLFKAINDTHGHVFGDLVLASLSRSFVSVLRRYDILGRIGGEEFLVIVPATDEEAAAKLAERLREAAQLTLVQDGTRSVIVTVSAGVTAVRREDARPEEMLRRADRALYRAKEEGRNRVRVYS